MFLRKSIGNIQYPHRFDAYPDPAFHFDQILFVFLMRNTGFKDIFMTYLLRFNFNILDSAPTKSNVVNWYLEEISGDIESQEELLEKKLIVEKVFYLPDT